MSINNGWLMRKLLLAIVPLLSCSNGGRDFNRSDGIISGRVVKGVVGGASVEVLEALSGEVVGSASTTEDGAFSVSIGAASGDFRVCAGGGTYTEEAVGNTVT